jgi:hypothetical protein
VVLLANRISYTAGEIAGDRGVEMRPEIIDAEWPSVLEEKPMQKARRRRRRFGPAAVGMWSSRAQTAWHHP